jgi:hypothetical protein
MIALRDMVRHLTRERQEALRRFLDDIQGEYENGAVD